MSKTDKLLLRTFAMQNRKTGKLIEMGCTTDTDEGEPQQWAHLKREGLVENSTRSGRGSLGHQYAVRPTPAGIERIKALVEQANQEGVKL